ncbi:ABC transporter substrate-binding protein [Pseudonocardia sp.]|uniref:ABC transporter substrate-binding protein n=1 Tax=Pseudonocardia sp. TaxID=60912 RepID=UPI003D0F9806
MRFPPRAAALVALAALTTTIAACGSGSGSGSSTGETTKLTVGIVGLTTDAPLYLANQKGWFAEQGLTVDISTGGGAAAIIPSLVNGERQIGTGNLISVLKANTQGLPLQAIAGQNNAASSIDDKAHITSAVIVPADSPIRTEADLKGSTIAVNTLNGLGDLTIKATLERDGIDPSGLKFVEMQFPDMAAAALAGRIDAAWLVEPYMTAGLDAGLRPVLYNFEGPALDFPIGVYFATRQFVSANPETVRKFKTVIDRATEYAKANPDETRAVVASYTKIPPATLQKMALPNYSATLDKDKVALLGQLMVRYGVVEKTPDLDGTMGPVYQQ